MACEGWQWHAGLDLKPAQLPVTAGVFACMLSSLPGEQAQGSQGHVWAAGQVAICREQEPGGRARVAGMGLMGLAQAAA